MSLYFVSYVNCKYNDVMIYFACKVERAKLNRPCGCTLKTAYCFLVVNRF